MTHPDHAAAVPPQRHSDRAYVWIAAALLTTVGALLCFQMWNIRRTVEAETHRRLATQAEVAANYAAQVFAGVRLSLQAIDDGLKAPAFAAQGTPDDVRRILDRIQAASTTISVMAVADDSGQVVARAGRGAPIAGSFADTVFFAAHRDAATSALRIDAQPGESPGIPVSIRCETPEGAFAGVVAAFVDSAVLTSFFAKLDVESVTLTLADGTPLARQAGRTPRAEDIQVERSAPVEGTGLAIVASVPKAAINAAWLGQAGFPLARALAASAITLVAVGYFRRRARHMRTIAERSERDALRSRAEALHLKGEVRKRSDFLAHMSHEIRTPLNAIIGFSEVIATDAMRLGGPERYRTYASDIHFSAEFLLSIINRILDMSKIEAGKWELEIVELNAAHLAATVRHLAAQRAEKEGVTIDAGGIDTSLHLRGDERTLVQMLLNLVINAVKFAGTDRLVRIDCVPVADGGVEFQIRDRGPGMTESDAERALRPFETSSERAASQRSDTGLGLPLARMFAELHGGSLRIASSPGEGTVVHVVLPARAAI